ncbi:flagellar assembly protein T N-terminal domain-containing protein [Catenovulum maritimum]|nr:flagellar assembly protein T N-terminal domain-containing protein [Catenovulum maritimum]
MKAHRKQTRSKLIAALSVLLLSSPVASLHAAWYQSTGSAKVINGQIDKARKKAVEEAVKEALLFSGASVTSTQQVTNGLLTQDMFMVRSSGVVNEIETVNESILNGELSITLRADIFAEDRQCFTTGYQKSISVVNFNIQHQEQAQVGQLYQLGQVVSKTIFNKLHSQSTNLNVRSYTPNLILPAVEQPQSQQLKFNEIKEISRQSDSQLVLSGSLTDLSLGKANNQISQWLTGAYGIRFFEMQLSLHDGYSGELLQSFNFQSDAVWDLDPKDKINIHSRQFWLTQYGQMIDNTLDKAINELENIAQCVNSKAYVIDANSTMLRLNLGSENSVNIGDKFKVLHQANFVDQAGHTRPHFIISPYKVVVSQTYANSAVASTEDQSYLANIQIGDILMPVVHN